MDDWDSVDGDVNADAIIHDRKHEAKLSKLAVWITLIVMLVSGAWFALNGESVALVALILSTAWYVVVRVHRSLFPMHTMLMIAERRIQLLEQRVQDLLMR